MPFGQRTRHSAALGRVGRPLLALALPAALLAAPARAATPAPTPAPKRAATRPPTPRPAAKTTGVSRPSAGVSPSGEPLPRLGDAVLAEALTAGKGPSPGLYRLLATTRGLPEAVPGPERGFLMTPRMRVAWWAHTEAKSARSPKPADVPARVAEDSVWLVFWPVRSPYISQGVASFDQQLPVAVRATAPARAAPIPAVWVRDDLTDLFAWFEYAEPGSLVAAFPSSVLAPANAFVVTYRALRSDGEHELDVTFAMTEKDVAKWK